jgi:hypothetical protein
LAAALCFEAFLFLSDHRSNLRFIYLRICAATASAPVDCNDLFPCVFRFFHFQYPGFA